MSKELDVVDHYDLVNQVAQLYIKGTTNPTTIAKELGIKRAEVLNLMDEWREIAKSNDGIRDQASEALQAGIQHYAMIVNRLWETVEQADVNSDYKTKGTVLKSIADIEAKKIEILQKAGLYDDASLGDELAQAEEMAEQIKELLKQVATEFPQTRELIMRGLGRIFGKAETVDVPTTEVIVAPGR